MNLPSKAPLLNENEIPPILLTQAWIKHHFILVKFLEILTWKKSWFWSMRRINHQQKWPKIARFQGKWIDIIRFFCNSKENRVILTFKNFYIWFIAKFG
jgi:hypothetical protein